jgi:hypothetical protein
LTDRSRYQKLLQPIVLGIQHRGHLLLVLCAGKLQRLAQLLLPLLCFLGHGRLQRPLSCVQRPLVLLGREVQCELLPSRQLLQLQRVEPRHTRSTDTPLN